MELIDFYKFFRNPDIIRALSKEIDVKAAKLGKDINIMEVCGGHTHTIMKFGLLQILPQNISFIHGPGCPVCIMPKERIDHAYILSMKKNVILCSLGDMIRVPGSYGTLQDARSKGADVRFVYSPLDVLKVAKENPSKKVIFFAIGFETTTPMTAALLEQAIRQKIENLLFYIAHVTVPEVMKELITKRSNQHSKSRSKIDAFLGPSHVSVITGSKIYDEFAYRYNRPVVVSGFEPVDVMESILMIIEQFLEKRCDVEIQYKRSVTKEGNITAQRLITKYFKKREFFKWRGIGNVKQSAWELKEEFEKFDAEKIYDLPNKEIEDYKLCICGDILRGIAKPTDCQVFATACTPTKPLGSCMVSSEGACAAYYKYGTSFLK